MDNTDEMTWREAVEIMLKKVDQKTQNAKVKNLAIIGDQDHEYTFAVLAESRIRGLIGTLECIKYYLIERNNQLEYEEGDEEEEIDVFD